MAVDLSKDRHGSSGDLFYQELISAHRGLSQEQSFRLNARLVLLLANQVGDIEVLRLALAEAARTLSQIGGDLQ